MAARDGAASIQGDAIRITALNMDGSIDQTTPVLTTNGFISASFGTEFEDGDEISEKAADGSICIQYKASDSMKGITFNLSLCSPDPEATALIAGGQIICAKTDIYTIPGDASSGVCHAKGEVIGYTSPAVGALVGNPVAVEIWSKAIVKGKPASCTPYFHWVFPYVRVRYEGDREFTNGALANEFSGTGVGNEALIAVGLNPHAEFVQPQDFVTYKDALGNPFSYIRTTTLPAMGWAAGGGGGSWVYTPENSLGDTCAPYSTGATAGTPGSFTPAGAMSPNNLTDLNAGVPSVVTASPTTAWTVGQYVTLADGTSTYWNGSAWAPGVSPSVLTLPITLGLTATSNGQPAAETGGADGAETGGPDGGVRVVPTVDGVAATDGTKLTAVDWGDGDTTFDATGGYIAHIYKAPATGVTVSVTYDGKTATTAPPFDVVET